ncbi:MAG: DUF4340 domain-containing protein [Butyrivibrio sp.]|uniref:DUF4340 domain-containing protein n=1 Tax=Butyrivibrio sp. TaxID=28121 RepID=UPI001B1E3A75|nr:DUF4340 domain-containing protein [Butyrivibrio sp.]MBO6242161.1 DUF4340 domain-containing protein [Butyrivibrio sp.]
MKRKNTLIILCVILALVFVGIIAVNAVEKHVESISTVDEVVFAADSESLTEIKWTFENKTLDFVKTDDVWTLSGDDSFPVNQEEIAYLIENFAEVHASFIIEDVEDYSQYGLDDPEAEITFITAEDETTISCGTFSTMDSKRYISINSGTVYLIDDDIESYLTSDRDEYLANDEIPYFQQIETVDLTGDVNLSLIYEEDADYSYTTSYNYYLKDDTGYLPLSDSSVSTFLGYFTHITFTDYVTYCVTDEELTKWGFDSPDLTIHVKGYDYDTDFTDDNDLGEEEEHYLYFKKIDDETIYLRVDESQIIYSYTPEDYETLTGYDYNSLRPTSVVDISAPQVQTITANIDSDQYIIDAETIDDIVTYTVNGTEIEGSQIVSDISALSVKEFDSTLSQGVTEFSVTVVLNDEANTSLSITLYRVDGDSCLVSLNGETLGLVDRTLMTTLKEDFTRIMLNLGKEEAESTTDTE